MFIIAHLTPCLGTTPLHTDLEKLVAEFVGKEDAITFGMGFATNSGNIPNLMGKVRYTYITYIDPLSHVRGR